MRNLLAEMEKSDAGDCQAARAVSRIVCERLTSFILSKNIS